MQLSPIIFSRFPEGNPAPLEESLNLTCKMDASDFKIPKDLKSIFDQILNNRELGRAAANVEDLKFF
jgi:hypothetical protein